MIKNPELIQDVDQISCSSSADHVGDAILSVDAQVAHPFVDKNVDDNDDGDDNNDEDEDVILSVDAQVAHPFDGQIMLIINYHHYCSSFWIRWRWPLKIMTIMRIIAMTIMMMMMMMSMNRTCERQLMMMQSGC